MLCVLGYSQNPLLFSKNWKIEKIIIGNNTIFPDQDTGYFINFLNTATFSYYSKVCSENFGNITYNTNSDDFTITQAKHSLTSCGGTGLTNFDTNYSAFFTKNSTGNNKINYSIESKSTGYALTLSNSSGDQVMYQFYTPATNLTSKTWVLNSLKINGINYNKPSQHTGGNTTMGTDGFFNTSYFNTGQGQIGFFADNKFRILSLAVTLADSFDPQISQFDGLYFDNFFSGTDGRIYPYIYEFSNENNTLTITKYNGDTASYSNKFLATLEVSKSKISVYPNPTSDVIKIENLKANCLVELTDSSGKLVRTISNIKSDKTEINIKNLALGIYYLKVDGQSVQKIIKK